MRPRTTDHSLSVRRLPDRTAPQQAQTRAVYPSGAESSAGLLRLACLGGMAIVLCLGAQMAWASDSLSSRSRMHIFDSQKGILDQRAAQQYNNSVRLQPPRVVTPSKWGTIEGDIPAYRGRYNGPFAMMAREAARRNGVPEDLFLRLVQQESNWNENALSHKGAIGLAQLMPATARVLRVDPKVPSQNLEGGARYLRQQYDTFRSWRLALAAYNAGPGAVEKHGGVPPYRETRNYVKKIWGD